MSKNPNILADRLAQYDAITGPRVGDFLRLPRVDERAAEFTRFTHAWDDSIQTGGCSHGSYYLGNGYLSYSGGLDPGLAREDIIASDEMKDGRIWFFDQGISGAGRGVSFTVPFRVFTVRPGANMRGIYEMGTGYHLGYAEHHAGSPYHYFITHRGTSHAAFRTEEELHQWLAEKNLRIGQPANQSQRILWPAEVA